MSPARGKQMTVDIHHMERAEAKKYLERLLAGLGSEVEEVVVIHGYRSGQTLQQMVRKELKYKRIRQKVQGLNPGITSLMILPK